MIGRAVGENIVRLRRIWPKIDGPDLIGEYRRVLGKAPDAETVARVVEGIIDSTTERFPPPPGVFAKAISEANARRAMSSRPRVNYGRWVDESALRDALAYLETCPDDERTQAERDVVKIRKRLSDRGAHAETSAPRWVRGENYPSEPPGTIRLRRIEATHAPSGATRPEVRR